MPMNNKINCHIIQMLDKIIINLNKLIAINNRIIPLSINNTFENLKVLQNFIIILKKIEKPQLIVVTFLRCKYIYK